MLTKKFLSLQKSANYSLNPIFRRAMSHNPGGIPGLNTPFRKIIGNPARCTLMFILFYGPGFWIPCAAFTYLMHKD